jgi:hypothetical protein
MSQHSVAGTAAILGILLFSSQVIHSQQTTTTNCNLNGNTANCTSDTTDYGAQQQRAYEQGQQVGNALGQGIAAAMQAHSQDKWVKKYCAAHPGQDWRWFRRSDGHTIATGHCATQDEKSVAAANEFMAHHRDYIPCTDNSEVITAYLQEHNLDPREKKSYERAFRDLKKTDHLKLYSN